MPRKGEDGVWESYVPACGGPRVTASLRQITWLDQRQSSAALHSKSLASGLRWLRHIVRRPGDRHPLCVAVLLGRIDAGSGRLQAARFIDQAGRRRLEMGRRPFNPRDRLIRRTLRCERRGVPLGCSFSSFKVTLLSIRIGFHRPGSCEILEIVYIPTIW